MNPGCQLDVSYDVYYYYIPLTAVGTQKALGFLIVNDIIQILTLSVNMPQIPCRF